LLIFRGHTGPVTSVQIFSKGDVEYLITSSWDKTIRLWNAKSKEQLASTTAHSDFIKCLLFVPSSSTLISGSSDKTAKIWNINNSTEGEPLSISLLGIISEHTRPVDCVAYDEQRRELYTGDSMGIIKSWALRLTNEDSDRPALVKEYAGHRTGVNMMFTQNGELWSASTDATVILHRQPGPGQPLTSTRSSIEHVGPVKCVLLINSQMGEPLYMITASGDNLYTWDIASFTLGEDEPDLLSTTECHADDITSISIWTESDTTNGALSGNAEPWIVTGSLDGTVRRWKLADLIMPVSVSKNVASSSQADIPPDDPLHMLTEEERRELDELLDSD
ncbi:WD40 repeat-like protein, partial [Serendipita vermifera]